MTRRNSDWLGYIKIIAICWGMIAGVLMLLAVISLFTSTRAYAANRSCLIDPSQEALLITKNKMMLESKLRDPSPIYTGTYMNCKSGAPVVCGYVNARNGYGAYVGQQRWIGVLFNASIESAMGAQFEKFWEMHCS